MQNKQHFESLKNLAPIEALTVWLDGNFGIGDEPALISAIRKDTRISLSDDAIIDAVCDAMDEELSAQECLERLASASKP